MTDSTLESILKRDRAIVLAGLAGVTALAWAHLFALAGEMGPMPAAMASQPWDGAEFARMFLMWAVMMVGMMVPGAAPMILIFTLVSRRSRERGRPFTPAGAFVSGYVIVWTAFSLAATALQWGLHMAALLSPALAAAGPALGAGLFLAAGLYQWTPAKNACLVHCRSPIEFISRGWRPGAGGALRMGLEHGAYCLGCCWLLMGLLFAGGVMNLLWAAGIALFVLVEKAAPRGEWVARASGAAMAAAGTLIFLAS